MKWIVHRLIRDSHVALHAMQMMTLNNKGVSTHKLEHRKIPFNVKTRTKPYAKIEVSYAKFK